MTDMGGSLPPPLDEDDGKRSSASLDRISLGSLLEKHCLWHPNMGRVESALASGGGWVTSLYHSQGEHWV